jgi:glycosyltransferase involved in cell wall biosynthesis
MGGGVSSTPPITVVTLSFNQGAFLRECVESVLAQDYPALEYVVVDPGSTDGSRALLEGYRARIDRLVLEPDDGPADGLNKGFARARGTILGFLNADDRFLPGALATVGGYFARHPEVDVLSGTVRQIDARGRPLLRAIPADRFDLARYAAGVCLIGQAATFFRRPAYERAGGFNRANRINWDSELWVDLALAGARFGTIGAALADFRLHPGGITGSRQHRARIRAEDRRIRAKLLARGVSLHGPWRERAMRLAYRFDPLRHLRWAAAGRLAATEKGR